MTRPDRQRYTGPERRQGAGGWITDAVETVLLGGVGLGYLVALVAGVALVADFVGVRA